VSVKRIVISGGPGTGKTALIQNLEQRGFHCFHEIIREMTLEARKNETEREQLINPLAFVKDPLEFNKRILEGRIEQFHHAKKLQYPFVFYDRGIPDIIAYMEYFNQPYDSLFLQPCQELKYHLAILLPPWKEIYRQDDQRLESFEEACEIHEHLRDSYHKCGYNTIDLPPGPVESRADRLLKLIANTNE
jgi:predicted ATPase